MTALLIVVTTTISSYSQIVSGLAIVAYVLGLRHGVDVDHIAAIDNVTRKLIQQKKKRFTVGTWFSLGHSTVVIAFVVLLVLLTKSVTERVPEIQSMGSVIGTLVSGTFLFAIGFVNLLIVSNVFRLFRRAKNHPIDESQIDNFLDQRGFMNRIFHRLFNTINEPWQMYPVGILFGLGFDTATEVGLIAISVGIGVSSSISIWQIMILPLLFTAGMVLTDTIDGVAMRFAYGWAFLNPLKKIFYNLTISTMSVIVAFAIGGIELIQILARELNLRSDFWRHLQNLNFETMGAVIVVIFVITWLSAYVLWKVKGYDRVLADSSDLSSTPGK